MAIAASEGFTWLKLSYNTIRRNPLNYPGIVIATILLSSLISAIPVIGPLLSTVCVIFCSVVTILAARDSFKTQRASYRIFLDVLKNPQPRVALVILGSIYYLGSAAISSVFSLLLTPSWATLMSGEATQLESLTKDALLNDFPIEAFLCAGILFFLLTALTYFAPFLIYDRRMTLLQSLFYSFFGVLRNIVPILAFMITFFAVCTLISTLLIALVPGQVQVFILPLVTAYMVSFIYAGNWVAYDAIFNHHQDTAIGYR